MDHVASASVVATTAMATDVLATACSVLAPKESLALVDGLPGVGCPLVTADGDVRRGTCGTQDELLGVGAGE